MGVTMNINKLMLEITRNCDLKCEHCCRGEKEIVNMSLETMANVFKDIRYVSDILLTGGEPFIAINQLEYLAELILSGKIHVGRISIITNATVLGSRTMRVLKQLQRLVELDLRLSSDVFHMMELDRLDLLEKRKENIKILKEFFGLQTHTSMKKDDFYKTRGLLYAGRAKNISKERLAEINSMLPFNYVISKNFAPVDKVPQIVDENNISGTFYVDVYGYVIRTKNSEFILEDAEARESNINLNEMSLVDATNAFGTYCKEQRELEYAKLLSK